MAHETLPRDLLREVTPHNVRSYVRAKGWQRRADVNGSIMLFSHPTDDVRQLIVPLDTIFDDYDKRIADVIRTLAEVEQRPATDVLHDVLMPDADVVRFSVVSPLSARGTMPLLDGIRLIDGARKSVLAAAHTVLSPTQYHARMSRLEAQQLLSKCQLGQTERGSFTITVACPLQAVEQEETLLPDPEPFTRLTTRCLLESVYELVYAIDNDNFSALYRTSEPKLSANLCDALLQMEPPAEQSALVIGVSWASTLPLTAEAKNLGPVKIRSEYFPIIRDVYAKLRPQKQPTSSLFVGYVESLNGKPNDENKVQGEITLAIVDEEELIKARVDLGPEDYQKAVEAHRFVKVVKLHAELRRARRIHRLTNVMSFEVVSE